MNFQSSVKSYAGYIADYSANNTTQVRERYYRRNEDINDPNAGIDLVSRREIDEKNVENLYLFPGCVVDITATINRDMSWNFLHIFVRAKSEDMYRLFACYANAIKYELCQYTQTENVVFEVVLDMDT